MAETYSWHPRIDLADAIWPRTRSLLEDELLSSWLIRNACAHGCSPLTLTGSLWPSWRCWTVDLDRGLTSLQAQKLCKVTGISLSDIFASTLRPIANVLTPSLEAAVAIWPWILALGTRNRRHAGGLQCCPLCLGEGPAYYRIPWRLAWHTCCQRHLVRLIDCCPQCQAPLQPHRLEQGDVDCSKCYRCSAPLSVALSELAFAPGALAFQIAGDECFYGLGLDSGDRCDASDWFYRSRFVMGLLRTAASIHTRPFSDFRMAFGLGEIQTPASGLPFEMLPVQERMQLLAAVWKIMEAGENELFQALIACSLRRSMVSIPAGCGSKRLGALLETLPPPAMRKRCPQSSQHPASQGAVFKMWMRLQRKVLRDG